MTSEDVEATARVYYLAPAIAEHLCLGDAGSKFQDCMGHTELAHLLEHLTVEIMNETGLAGTISTGRTRNVRATTACSTSRYRAPTMPLHRRPFLGDVHDELGLPAS